jgi:serine/threonine-protein kinase
MVTLAPERYDVLERIATGGMAEVFRAKAYGAHGFEKTIAIKRILPELAQHREFEDRFISEAKLVGTLTHANIVQVLDFGRAEGSLYIAMEYVDGPNLAALLRHFARRASALPIDAALYAAIELCKGIDFAHERGVIHRDISPSNVLVSTAGEVKIADFGIARAIGPGTTGPGDQVMGKWRYMSPEQTRGDELDARSDLFSLGVVIHEMLTGKPLFAGTDVEEIVREIRFGATAPPSALRPGVPDGLDAIAARALARDPDERYQGADGLLADLVALGHSSQLVLTRKTMAAVVAEVVDDRPTRWMSAVADASADEVIEAELRDLGVDGGRQTVATAPGKLLGGETATRTFIRVAGNAPVARWELGEVVDPGPDRPRPGRTRSRRGIGAAVVIAALLGVGLTLGLVWSRVAGDGASADAVAVGATDARRLAIGDATPAIHDAAPALRDATLAAPVDAAPAPDAAPVIDAAARPVETGTVAISAEPWAYVYRERRKVGETPPRIVLRLPAGKQRLRLYHPTYGSRTITVRVKAGRRTSYRFDLRQ